MSHPSGARTGGVDPSERGPSTCRRWVLERRLAQCPASRGSRSRRARWRHLHPLRRHPSRGGMPPVRPLRGGEQRGVGVQALTFGSRGVKGTGDPLPRPQQRLPGAAAVSRLPHRGLAEAPGHCPGRPVPAHRPRLRPLREVTMSQPQAVKPETPSPRLGSSSASAGPGSPRG